MRIAPLVAILALLSSATAGAAPFRFTVSSDGRENHERIRTVLGEAKRILGDEGAFHVTPGDADPPADNHADLRSVFGSDVVWYPVVGNHEVETASDMDWLRKFFPSLPNVVRNGPPGGESTTYSFDYGNAHFVVLNVYYDGTSDSGGWGEVGDRLYQWLADDLAASDKPVKIVFGHEPAYPQYRHIGDSLDQNPRLRDRFWALLEQEGVQAYVCGHTHTYSRYRPQGSSVWQIDSGNAGVQNPMSFLDVTVADTFVRFDAWAGNLGSSFSRVDSVTIELPAVEPPPVTVVTVGPEASVVAEAGGEATLELSRQGSLDAELRVGYALSGTAAGEDFGISPEGEVVLAPGEATAQLQVAAIDDDLIEEDESLVVTLLPGEGYELGDAEAAMVVIADDESEDGLPRVGLQSASTTAVEGGAPLALVVTRTGDTSAALTARLATSGTAVAVDDYELDLGTELTFAPGESAVTLTLSALADDLDEGTELLALEVLAGEGYSLGAPSYLEVVIEDPSAGPLTREQTGCGAAGGAPLAVLLAPAILALVRRSRRRN